MGVESDYRRGVIHLEDRFFYSKGEVIVSLCYKVVDPSDTRKEHRKFFQCCFRFKDHVYCFDIAREKEGRYVSRPVLMVFGLMGKGLSIPFL